MRRAVILALACLLPLACSNDDAESEPGSDSGSDSDSSAGTLAGASSTVAAATTTSVATEVTDAAEASETRETSDAAAGDTGPGTTEIVTTAVATTAASTTSVAPTSTAAPYVSATYADPVHWICRPDMDDRCDSDLDVTVVAADGTATVEPFAPAEDGPADCLYFYPTSSEDQSLNSDLVGGGELLVTKLQVGRLSQVCDVYAPMYRSVTLPALFGQVQGDRAEAGRIAYADVLDAWRHYVANDNGGRGVVLVGHSQGASHLARLLREEIDPDPAMRDLLVSAYITGSAVAVPIGADVGGDLQEIPLCRARDQVGCVVTYATFRSTAPPPENAFFGRPRGAAEGTMAGCVNPAAPEGGAVELHSAFMAGDWALTDRSLVPTTAFMDFPGLLTGECTYENGFSYLEVAIHADPGDPRADDLQGADLTPEWGLHLVDLQVVNGDVVEMVREQIAAHAGS